MLFIFTGSRNENQARKYFLLFHSTIVELFTVQFRLTYLMNDHVEGLEIV